MWPGVNFSGQLKQRPSLRHLQWRQEREAYAGLGSRAVWRALRVLDGASRRGTRRAWRGRQRRVRWHAHGRADIVVIVDL